MKTAGEIIDVTADYVRRTLAVDSSGHDWFHVERVWKNALRIGTEEGADMQVVALAALLHDIADWKFYGGDEAVGPQRARDWLVSQGVAAATIDEVCQIIERVSFKGAGVANEPMSLAGQVVQDADRLDAIGAIGVARAFAYGGHAGRAMYDPGIPPERHDSFAAYKKNSGPTINHFYEKLLLLKDRMNTAAGRRLAHERDRYMREFLQRFLDEWNVTF